MFGVLRLPSFLKPLSFLFLISCGGASDKATENGRLYTLMSSDVTGVDFVNQVDYTDDFNPYIYKNFYNGAGVAIGDINNDGLSDILFAGNLEPNKLYLNKGNWEFEDITEKAGVASEGVWSTGVSFVDINSDGFLDIYVCKSGTPVGDNRHNEFFVNNGDLTFSEQAKDFGIADLGLSVHAAFFDYDKDGDLDCYLLNNSIRSVGGYDLIKDQREIRDSLGGNKLYRNDSYFLDDSKDDIKVSFTDVSEEAGIYGSQIGFGLGVAIGDVNRDGWQDIFVSNDFFEKDYLYINMGDGTFEEELENFIGEISLGSMGADIADLNNDGFPEIFVTEMLPENDARMKTTAVLEGWDKYQLNLSRGYYRQFPRNVLQLNNGGSSFSEIGRYSGVYATDWSWGALILDMDNDGFKDLYVANGIYKDLTDHDYINYISNPAVMRKVLVDKTMGAAELFDQVPSNPIVNYAFHNQQDLTFENKAESWGLNEPSFSNGSAYGDLDNDGDLDLVVNNINMPSFLYRNNTELELNNQYLVFKLEGEKPNTFALGTKITLKGPDLYLYQEAAPFRGFQSTVDPRVHFGLGQREIVDSVIVEWPNSQVTVLTNVNTSQIISLNQVDATGDSNSDLLISPGNQIFKETTDAERWSYLHSENDFIDFDRERLLFHMRSSEGPSMCKADVNGDGLEDVFIGGSRNERSALLLQQPNGSFRESNQSTWQTDEKSEHTDCQFLDMDGDGDLDLYVTSGGNEYSASSTALIDHIYINNGKGDFSKSVAPVRNYRFESISCIDVADFDGDNDPDIFVGGRSKALLYGVPVNGHILKNDGNGNYSDVTKEIAPDLEKIGHITDALWFDFDGDSDEDLALVGEWMSVTILENDGGRFVDVTAKSNLDSTNGLWYSLEKADLDGDGDLDLVAGNMGLNSRFKASRSKPITMHVNDFDQNGTVEQIISVYEGENSYPLVLRDDLLMQIPGLKKKYLEYHNYKEQSVEDIFSPEQLSNAIEHRVYETRTSIIENLGDGTFELKALPTRAQLSVIYAIEIGDFNKDGKQDILLGGNLSKAKPETGIYHGSYGELFLGDGMMNFTSTSYHDSGFFVKGEIRDFITIKRGSDELVLTAVNNDTLRVFKY